jgi:hypothetical protein
MASNNFFLVPQIVADDKYFDVSRPEILRDLRAPAGKFDRTEEHETKDEYNVDFRVIIRLNVNCQSKVPEGWTIALKLHNELLMALTGSLNLRRLTVALYTDGIVTNGISVRKARSIQRFQPQTSMV